MKLKLRKSCWKYGLIVQTWWAKWVPSGVDVWSLGPPWYALPAREGWATVDFMQYPKFSPSAVHAFVCWFSCRLKSGSETSGRYVLDLSSHCINISVNAFVCVEAILCPTNDTQLLTHLLQQLRSSQVSSGIFITLKGATSFPEWGVVGVRPNQVSFCLSFLLCLVV